MGVSGVRQELKNWVEEWARLDNLLKNDLANAPSIAAGERQRLRRLIMERLRDKPQLADEVAEWGFTYEPFQEKYGDTGLRQPDDGKGGTGTQRSEDEDEDGRPVDEFGDGDGGGGNKGGKGAGGGGGGDQDKSDRLAGKKGRHYEVFKGPNGKVWIAYWVKLENGRKVYDRWQLDEKMQSFYGFTDKDFKHATRAQLKRMANNGFWKASYGSGGRHPRQVYLEEMAETFGVAPSMMKNKEVHHILLEAFHENWDGAKLLQALKGSTYFQNKTDRRATWILETNDTTKKDLLTREHLKLQEFAADQFGELDYTKYFSDDRLKAIAEKSVSGAAGWDTETAMLRIRRKAENIAGTTASINKEESRTNTALDIEDKVEQLRQEAVQWAGYGAVPSHGSLMTWATDILNKKRSDADWLKFIGNHAQQIHKWLGPDERFMDTQSSYKARAESILGYALPDDDKLLQDFTYRDDGGKVTPDQRVGFAQFDDAVRLDPRFRTSDNAIDKASEFAAIINNTFMGVR